MIVRTKEEVIAAIQDVAKQLASERVSQDDFEKLGSMSVSGVTYVFGSWNRAVIAAGLIPYEPSERKPNATPDQELMEEIIRLTRELGKRPSDREMSSFGRYSPKPYVKRWGSYTKGREAAYEQLGFPDLSSDSAHQ